MRVLFCSKKRSRTALKNGLNPVVYYDNILKIKIDQLFYSVLKIFVSTFFLDKLFFLGRNFFSSPKKKSTNFFFRTRKNFRLKKNFDNFFFGQLFFLKIFFSMIVSDSKAARMTKHIPICGFPRS